MIMNISDNTKAILLLTAPLLLNGGTVTQYDLLKPSEYNKLMAYLVNIKKQPADLLSYQADEILNNCVELEKHRVMQLLNRGFLLSQVLEYWQARGIWVVSRADDGYPNRLKTRLKEQSPAILYGCGDINLLNYGGLAIVGSRQIDNDLISYTESIAELSTQAGRMIISGGAQGVDSTAMYKALRSEGWACGVLADNLEKAALSLSNREFLRNGQLVLISACDPKAGFNTGHAMQRNKYIYALSDIALVVNSDLNKGGTWAGAIEQLNKYRQIPIYIRSTGTTSKGLQALNNKGALLWKNPSNIQEFSALFNLNNVMNKATQMSLLDCDEEDSQNELTSSINHENKNNPLNAESNPLCSLKANEKLFNCVKELIRNSTLNSAKKEIELADELDISTSQMKKWLQRLVDEKHLIKKSRPIKYIWNND
ncbi:DNA-processing protein DprA [Haemophilus influenzae]